VFEFEVALPNDLKIQGVILSEQIKNLDFSERDISFVCKVYYSVVENVQRNILALVVE